MEDPQNERFLQQLERFVVALRQGEKPERLEVEELSSDAQRQLASSCNRLRDSFIEILDFLTPLIEGDWVSFAPADRDGLSRIFLELQEGMRCLCQQMTRLATGDLHQKVRAISDFSAPLNALAVKLASQEMKLQEKRREIELLLEKTQVLRQENRRLTDRLQERPSTPVQGPGAGREAPLLTIHNEVGSYHSLTIIPAESFAEGLCERLRQGTSVVTEAEPLCCKVESCLCAGEPQNGFCPIAEVVRSGKPYQGEKKHTLGDGTTQELEIVFFPLVDGDGRVHKLLRVARDITTQRQSQREVHQLAYYDPLTKLPNRTLFIDRLNQSLAQVQRHGHQLALLYIDLDDFKAVNDNFGHHNGDRLLQEMARRMRFSLRESDSIARWGGDEFLVFLSDIDGEREIVAVINKLLCAIQRPVQLSNAVTAISGSIGVAIFPDDGLTSQTLLNHADLAMYAAKKAGKNNYHFFSEEMHRAVQKRTQLEADLGLAVKNGEFFLAYQPLFDVQSNRICGVEALLRWQTVDGRVLEPAAFLRVANETGMILPIGEWVLRTACRQVNFWHRKGFPHLRLGINLSHRQLKHPEFPLQLERALVDTGVDPQRVVLEMSEQMFSNPGQELTTTLPQLKTMGVHLAVDDFGTGSFSLASLARLPIDRIKIDQSILHPAVNHRRSAALVESILVMAQRLNLDTVAEGVECDEHLAFLSVKGCREMQGYYFGRPMKPLELSCLMDRAEMFPLS